MATVSTAVVEEDEENEEEVLVEEEEEIRSYSQNFTIWYIFVCRYKVNFLKVNAII